MSITASPPPSTTTNSPMLATTNPLPSTTTISPTSTTTNPSTKAKKLRDAKYYRRFVRAMSLDLEGHADEAFDILRGLIARPRISNYLKAMCHAYIGEFAHDDDPWVDLHHSDTAHLIFVKMIIDLGERQEEVSRELWAFFTITQEGIDQAYGRITKATFPPGDPWWDN